MRFSQLPLSMTFALVVLVIILGVLIGNGNILLVFFAMLSLVLLTLALVKRNRSLATGGERSLIVVGIVIVIGLNVIALPKEEPIQSAVATLMLIVCLYPTWRYVRSRDARLPFMPVLGIIYALQHAVPIFIPVDRYLLYAYAPSESYQTALLLAFAGLVVMLITYYCWPERLWKGIIPAFRGFTDDLASLRATTWAILIGIAGITAYTLVSLGLIEGSLTSLINFLGQTSLLSMAILLYLQLRHQLPFWGYIFLWGILIPLYFLISMSTGFVWPVIRGLAVLAIVYVWIKRRIPWVWIVSAAAITMVLLLAKPAFRALTWNDQTPDSNPIATGVLWSRVIRDNLLEDPTAMIDGVQGAINRMDVNALFATVIARTPSVVPYWEGKTYENILVAFIPRIAFPDKPTENIGQEFGHRYGFLDPTNTNTSINLPQIVEMYANFGPAGVLIGMAALGLIYKLFRYVLENPDAGTWGQLSAVLIYAQFVLTEANFTVVFGNMLYWLLLLYLLGRIVCVPKARDADVSVRAQLTNVDTVRR